MARAKSTTRIAHLHIANTGKDSTWVTNHSIGLLNTVIITVADLLDEAGVTLLDETGATLTDEPIKDGLSEMTTISFVGNELPTPNAEVGLFKAV